MCVSRISRSFSVPRPCVVIRRLSRTFGVPAAVRQWFSGGEVISLMLDVLLLGDESDLEDDILTNGGRPRRQTGPSCSFLQTF